MRNAGFQPSSRRAFCVDTTSLSSAILKTPARVCSTASSAACAAASTCTPARRAANRCRCRGRRIGRSAARSLRATAIPAPASRARSRRRRSWRARLRRCVSSGLSSVWGCGPGAYAHAMLCAIMRVAPAARAADDEIARPLAANAGVARHRLRHARGIERAREIRELMDHDGGADRPHVRGECGGIEHIRRSRAWRQPLRA